jgi:hypothetical protein
MGNTMSSTAGRYRTANIRQVANGYVLVTTDAPIVLPTEPDPYATVEWVYPSLDAVVQALALFFRQREKDERWEVGAEEKE